MKYATDYSSPWERVRSDRLKLADWLYGQLSPARKARAEALKVTGYLSTSDRQSTVRRWYFAWCRGEGRPSVVASVRPKNSWGTVMLDYPGHLDAHQRESLGTALAKVAVGPAELRFWGAAAGPAGAQVTKVDPKCLDAVARAVADVLAFFRRLDRQADP